MATLGNTPRPAYVYDTETDTWVPVGVGAHTHSDIPNTLLDAKGDLITATADNVPARLAKGADGTVLVSDSSTSTGLAWQPYAAQVVAGKNLVLNGSFDIWQRGTSIAMTTTNWGADRWGNYRVSGGSTISRQSSGLTGFQYCARIQRDNSNASTSIIYIGQPIDISTSTPFIGKTVTLSFYAKKGSNFSATNSILRSFVYTGSNASDYDGFHGSYTGLTSHIYKESTLTESWQRFEVFGTIISGTQILIQFEFTPTGTAGLNDYVDITGIQLELGSIATPFSRAGGTIQGELAACQRYYIRMLSGTGSYTPFATGQVYSSTGAQIVVNHPVAMRIPPTSIEYASLGITNSGAGVVVPTSFSLSNPGQTASMLLTTNASGLVAGYSTLLVAAATTSAYLAFNAEL
jgi:hypothetical protein